MPVFSKKAQPSEHRDDLKIIRRIDRKSYKRLRESWRDLNHSIELDALVQSSVVSVVYTAQEMGANGLGYPAVLLARCLTDMKPVKEVEPGRILKLRGELKEKKIELYRNGKGRLTLIPAHTDELPF